MIKIRRTRRVNCIDLMITPILSRVKRVNDRSRLFNYHFKLAKNTQKQNGKLFRFVVDLNLIFFFFLFSHLIFMFVVHISLCANFDWIVKQKVISIKWHWHSIIQSQPTYCKCKIAQFHLCIDISCGDQNQF